MAPAEGRVLGNYVVRSLLGRGGMGHVYAAEHRFLGDAVAIKLLHPHIAGDAALGERFVQEAARTRAIAHPNVVRVIDFGRADDDGALYLVMERLDGEDLASRLRRQTRLDPAEVARLGAAIADGMQAAHERGIVHRDLKPANVVVLPDGQPKIVDFGIGKWLGVDAAATGPGIGTPQYMAPEQLTGGVVAACIDVWALGVILFEAATGRLPFDGFADGRCPQLFEAAPRPGALAAMPAELEAVIVDCLHKNPALRPATMRDVAERLRGTDSRATRSIAPPTIPTPAMPPATIPTPAAAPGANRAPLTIATAAIVALAVAAMAGAAWWRWHPTVAEVPPPHVVASPPAPPPTPPPQISPLPPVTVTPSPPPRPATAAKPHRATPKRSRIYGEKLD